MNSKRKLQLNASMWTKLPFSSFIQLLMTTLGAASFVTRSIKTPLVIAQLSLLLPPLFLAMWLLWRLTQHQGTVRSPLGLPLLLAAGALVLSSFFGIADGYAVMIVLTHWAASGLLLFITADLLALGWQPRVFVRGVLLTVSVILVWAGVNTALWVLHWAALWRPGEQLLPVGYRVTVLGMHPNLVVMILNIGIPCVIVALWAAQKVWQRVVWSSWLALAVVVLLFTSSRGGWLGAAASCCVTLSPLLWSDYRAGRLRRLGITILSVIGYGALFGVLFLSQRNEVLGQHGGDLLSPVGRFTFWHRALLVFGAHPLIGVGPAGFDVSYNIAEISSVFFQPEHAHSLYLTTLSELGIVGSVAVLGLIVAAVIVWVRAWRSAPAVAPTLFPWSGRLLLLASGAVGVGMFVHGLVDTPSPLIAGLILCLIATGLAEGNCWQFVASEPQEQAVVPTPGYATGFVAPPFNMRFAALSAPVMHIAIVIIAVLAWSSYTLVSRQVGRWQVVMTAANEALAQGDAERATLLAEQAIMRQPERGDAYSLRALALATRARSDSRWLAAALAAEDEAIQHDPTNHAAPLNRAALLAELGQRSEAEKAVRAFIATDTGMWGPPALLLAHLREQASDTANAHTLWQQALNREPDLYDAAACEHSTVCQSLTPPESPYRVLWSITHHDLPDAESLAVLAREAGAWENVDLWATGSIIAGRSGNTHAEQRFLQAAEDQSQVIGSAPTEWLAIAQLRNATQHGDRVTARTLLNQMLATRSTVFVPQLGRLLTTETDAVYARAAVDTATWLGDPVALARAQAYLRETQVVAIH